MVNNWSSDLSPTLAMLIWIRTRTLVFMVPQPQAAASKVDMRAASTAAPPARVAQRRWPVAASIWAALAVSVAMWAGIGWVVLSFMSLFS